MQIQAFLRRFEVSPEQAADIILANASNPSGLFALLGYAQAGSDMIARILQTRLPGANADLVHRFFASHQLDASELDAAYFAFLERNTPVRQGTNGADRIDGTEFEDRIEGLNGADIINGMDGDDLLRGGGGADTLNGGFGMDWLYGGSGSDTLDAGSMWRWRENPQTPWVMEQEVDATANFLQGGTGNDILKGSFGHDRLEGGDDADTIHGNAGNDVLIAGDGNDWLYGGFGSDTHEGGAGDDMIRTNDAYQVGDINVVDGGSGNDTLYITIGDHARGGIGNDVISVVDPRHPADMFLSSRNGLIGGGEGSDTINVALWRSNRALEVDLFESVSASDTINWSLHLTDGREQAAMVVAHFNPAVDRIQTGVFNMADSLVLASSITQQFGLHRIVNHAQLLSHPDQAFHRTSPNPANQDQWGKGFFVVRGATAGADDNIAIASFLDAYGANHRYGSNFVHMFLVNVGDRDAALVRFRDDGGGNNSVQADEIFPVARFVGLRTDDFIAANGSIMGFV